MVIANASSQLVRSSAKPTCAASPFNKHATCIPLLKLLLTEVDATPEAWRTARWQKSTNCGMREKLVNCICACVLRVQLLSSLIEQAEARMFVYLKKQARHWKCVAYLKAINFCPLPSLDDDTVYNLLMR